MQIHDITEDWEFVLLASDGIWDVLTNDDVVRLCLRKIEMGIPPEQICEELMTECLSPDLLMTGTDNMTVVLICFLHNKTYEDLSKRAKEINVREQKKSDELHNAYNDSYPATSADTSESISVNSTTTINVNVSNFDDDENKGDSGEVNGDKKMADADQNHDQEVPQADDAVGNVESAPKTPQSPTSNNAEKDDADEVQECKKHKENDSGEDLK